MSRFPALSGRARDEDQAPPCTHVAYGGASTEEHAVEVGGYGVVPSGIVQLFHRHRNIGPHARVADEDVHVAEALDCTGHKGIVGVTRGKIPLKGHGVAAEPPQRIHELCCLTGARAVGDGHIGPGAGKQPGAGGTDAARAARDQCRLPGQVNHSVASMASQIAC